MTQNPNPQRTRQRGVTACVVAQAVCSLAYLEVTLAQEQDRVTIDARRCLELEAADERLACFEAQVGEAQSRGSPTPATAAAPATAATPATATAPATVATPATAVAPALSSQQSIPTVEVASLPAEGAPADAPGQSEWVGSVTALRQREPNQYVITLDSGEVWQQRGADRYPLRVGQKVRIYQTRFGTRLQADGVNGFIHVFRVP